MNFLIRAGVIGDNGAVNSAAPQQQETAVAPCNHQGRWIEMKVSWKKRNTCPVR